MSLILLLLYTMLYYGNSKTSVISNTATRMDTNGNIMDAHDGKILNNFPGYEGTYFYYALGFGGCQQVAANQYCSTFIAQNGSKVPICGFEYNQTISVFTTKTLESGSWVNHGNVLKIDSRPYGIYLSPSAVYNPIQKKYIIYSTFLANDSFTSDVYLAASSDTPFGPFKVMNPAVNLTNSEPGDAKLFSDPVDGKGYLIYTSISSGHKIVVEQLTDDYLYSTGIKSEVFNQSSAALETPTLFKHVINGKYYATASFTCCYCDTGSNVMVFISDNVLGPYKQMHPTPYINSIYGNNTDHKDLIISAQQTDVFLVNTTKPKSYQYVFLGNRWQSTPDGTMGHDFTIWIPLEFNGTNIEKMTYYANFTLELA